MNSFVADFDTTTTTDERFVMFGWDCGIEAAENPGGS